MKLAHWVIFFASLTSSTAQQNDAGLSDEAAELYAEGLTAQADLRTGDALILLLQVEKLAPDNAKVMQKIARQYSDSTIDTSIEAEQRRLLGQALDYSQRATDLDPNDPVNVLSLAITKGKLANLNDTKAKVESAREIKVDAQRALELDPDYAWAHHVLGRWHREVNELGSVARFFTKLLYGGLPASSIDEAISHLERATELDPENLGHRVELGLAYQAAADHAKARQCFEQALGMPIREKHDEAAQARARNALEQLD